MSATGKTAASEAEQKHTPGPWRIAPNSQYAGGHLNIDAGENGGGGYVCLVGRPDEKSAIADARLIAAAPDILAKLRQSTAALEALLAERPSLNGKIAGDTTVGNTLAESRAAIARAEG